jgi:hypothetical protein
LVALARREVGVKHLRGSRLGAAGESGQRALPHHFPICSSSAGAIRLMREIGRGRRTCGEMNKADAPANEAMDTV